MPLLVPMPSYHPLSQVRARPSEQNMKTVRGVTSVIRLHYGRNVCALPQPTGSILMPNVTLFGSGAFGKLLGYWHGLVS